jgi:hypothetical protein
LYSLHVGRIVVVSVLSRCFGFEEIPLHNDDADAPGAVKEEFDKETVTPG